MWIRTSTPACYPLFIWRQAGARRDICPVILYLLDKVLVTIINHSRYIIRGDCLNLLTQNSTMDLERKVMEKLKSAMKAKDRGQMEALRSVKSAILLAKTESNSKELSDEAELKLVQKLVKQRRDSAEIYREQNREDLAEPETKEAEIIAQFLPEQMSESEIAEKVDAIIAKTGADSMKDMGKVMGITSKELAGKADGKTISKIVKEKLSS